MFFSQNQNAHLHGCFSFQRVASGSTSETRHVDTNRPVATRQPVAEPAPADGKVNRQIVYVVLSKSMCVLRIKIFESSKHLDRVEPPPGSRYSHAGDCGPTRALTTIVY